METGITDIGERHLEGVRLDAEGAISAAVFAESSENKQRVDGGGSGRAGRGECRGGIGGSDVDCSGRKREAVTSSRESKEITDKKPVGSSSSDSNEEDEESGFCIPCGMLLCGDTPNADPDVFRAANNSGLVYDGRLVVDAKFRSSDRSVLAGGTLTKFSRAHGTDVPRHEMYNAREVRCRRWHYPSTDSLPVILTLMEIRLCPARRE